MIAAQIFFLFFFFFFFFSNGIEDTGDETGNVLAYPFCAAMTPSKRRGGVTEVLKNMARDSRSTGPILLGKAHDILILVKVVRNDTRRVAPHQIKSQKLSEFQEIKQGTTERSQRRDKNSLAKGTVSLRLRWGSGWTYS
jgi:hypothetical protein